MADIEHISAPIERIITKMKNELKLSDHISRQETRRLYGIFRQSMKKKSGCERKPDECRELHVLRKRFKKAKQKGFLQEEKHGKK
ncbi:MAG: hypothetical protein K9M56_04350 [Victivallales bacterium]|nr:hypothetical protein [Victivallales bacterium]